MRASAHTHINSALRDALINLSLLCIERRPIRRSIDFQAFSLTPSEQTLAQVCCAEITKRKMRSCVCFYPQILFTKSLCADCLWIQPQWALRINQRRHWQKRAVLWRAKREPISRHAMCSTQSYNYLLGDGRINSVEWSIVLKCVHIFQQWNHCKTRSIGSLSFVFAQNSFFNVPNYK